ncbi:LOW QUALITY PROTEIN: hypothetical protein HID58_071715 [Brassica napus]|uniref:Uncharacterized protein n=1 Tax=Brassica napus TaxID=3708 RepID=A0ABQ7Z2G3_BRANA|nr:LOW QUALITY PROTEIN: hypothetical protein HID58_071715 [Brassica napus]
MVLIYQHLLAPPQFLRCQLGNRIPVVKTHRIRTVSLNFDVGLRYALRPIETVFCGSPINCSPPCSSFVVDLRRDCRDSVTAIVLAGDVGGKDGLKNLHVSVGVEKHWKGHDSISHVLIASNPYRYVVELDLESVSLPGIHMTSASRTVIRLLKRIESLGLERNNTEKVSTGSRQERLVLLALLLLRTPSPLMRMCSPQSCDQSVGERGLSLKLAVWIGGNPVERNVETELESLEIERRVCYLATKGSERMRFETCPSKKI